MMKSILAILLPLAAFADAATLPTGELDRGGLTYDFASVSARWHAIDATTNYFAGFSWQSKPERIHLFGKDLAEDAPVRSAVMGLPKWAHAGLSTRVVAGDDVLAACGGDAKVAGHLVNESFIDAGLPDAEGGDYELSFRYAARNTLPNARESFWMVGFADRPGEPWVGATWHPLDDFDGSVHERRVVVNVGPGKRALRFAFEFNGVGDFRVESVSLSRCPRPTTPVSVRFAVPEGVDGTFALAEGQVGLCLVEWRANDATKWDPKRLRVRVELPAGIRLRACNFAELKTAERTPGDGGSTVWQLETRHGMGRFLSDVPRKGSFSRYTPFQLMLEPRGGGELGERGEKVNVEGGCEQRNVEISDTHHSSLVTRRFSHLSLCVTYDGKPVSNVERIRFEVVPRVMAAAPKRLLSGMNVGMCLFDWNGDVGAQERLAQTMADAGMRTIHWPKWQSPPGVDETMLPALRKAGFTHLTPYDCSLADGYLVGDGSARPADERFAGDVKTPQVENASCPIAIYTEMPHVLNYFTNALPRILAGSDGMWANWEPYFFASHGCFCDRCRAAFEEYAGKEKVKVKSEEVRMDRFHCSPSTFTCPLDWPKDVKKGGRYEDLYVDFRAAEHAKVVKTVEKWVRRHTGGKKSMGFVPGVAWCEMATHERTLCDAKSDAVRGPRERSVRDYEAALGWMSPWGPYPRWNVKEGYAYAKSRHLVYWVAAKDVRDQLDRDCAKGPKPKLMAYPCGKQGDVWIVQPEHLAMAFDAFYVNGWHAVVPYFFPMGYDARFWRAVADANARAAKYEDWYLDGVRADGETKAVPVPEFAANADFVTSYVPAATNVSLLQTAAFRLKGTTVVAALNYWEKGEAFFDLKLAGLKEDRYAVVDEAGVLYAKSAHEPYWTAQELAQDGVLLMVGAARTRVFEIRPTDGDERRGVCAVRTVEQMREAYEARRAALAEEAARDASEETARRAAGRHPPET